MYKVDITRAARKNLRKLSNVAFLRIRPKLRALADNPRPPGCRKIVSEKDRYRMRIGDYRILYSIDDEQREVVIHRIAHRKEVY